MSVLRRIRKFQFLLKYEFFTINLYNFIVHQIGGRVPKAFRS